jgi:hypothetical protein
MRAIEFLIVGVLPLLEYLLSIVSVQKANCNRKAERKSISKELKEGEEP